MVNEYSDSLKTLEYYTQNFFDVNNQLYKIEKYNGASYFLDSVVIAYINSQKIVVKKYNNESSNTGPYTSLDKTIEYFYDSEGILVSDTTYKNLNYDHEAVKATKYTFDQNGNCTKISSFYKNYPDNSMQPTNPVLHQ